mmetsp:Transcript_83519/g.215090  ORF Transcript_83519/g.215090 Transcript_83519/m.215090 type:complete len:218 (+) Transcript_83519:2802-3455(+)
MVSGLVVATGMYSSVGWPSSPATTYLKWYKKPLTSSYSTSRSLTAVCSTGLQFTMRWPLKTRPISCSRMKASMTAPLMCSFRVNCWRDQSQEAPMRLNWSTMAEPFSSFHDQTRSRKASRPTSFRDVPSATNCRSTSIWVAMPAWSVPGSHSVRCPYIRWKRAITSSRLANIAWPMCSRPVTLGGGMGITYDSCLPAPGAIWSAISGLKNPLLSHHR